MLDGIGGLYLDHMLARILLHDGKENIVVSLDGRHNDSIVFFKIVQIL